LVPFGIAGTFEDVIVQYSPTLPVMVPEQFLTIVSVCRLDASTDGAKTARRP